MEDLTKKDLLIAKVDSLKKSIERVGFDDLKIEAIIGDVIKIRRDIELDEEFYKRIEKDRKREEKTKKISFRMLVLLAILVIGTAIDESYFGFLSLWVIELIGYLFVTILILVILVVTHYEKRN